LTLMRGRAAVPVTVFLTRKEGKTVQ